MIFLFYVIILLLASYFFIQAMKTKDANHYLRSHPLLVKGILFMYIVFSGCFTFPIRSEPFPLDFTRAYLLIASYSIIGIGFVVIFGGNRIKFIYPTVLLLTILGMVCRFVLEYGEVSNTYNFTFLNIISYIAVIPTYTIIVYLAVIKYLTKKK